jgi:hypothetical protein
VLAGQAALHSTPIVAQGRQRQLEHHDRPSRSADLGEKAIQLVRKIGELGRPQQIVAANLQQDDAIAERFFFQLAQCGGDGCAHVRAIVDRNAVLGGQDPRPQDRALVADACRYRIANDP